MNIIIYCRVSSKDQVDGTSLDSQETACREYAARQGWSILQTFIEEGESAKFADRTKLLELMSFCQDKSRGIEGLLVWKLDRFARNIEDHYMIKAALRRVGVKVISVTEPVDTDPNGKLMEAILAGFAQFDNDIRSLRTVQGMQQRLREGICPWAPPLGYLPPKAGKKREPDRPDPHTFELLQQAWQLLATGSYSRSAIHQLLRKWGVRGRKNGLIAGQTLDDMWRNEFYAGVLRNPWTGEKHVGRHVPMVTPFEFARVQQAIGPADVRHNSLVHSDFPVRGLVQCPSCLWTLTAAWSRGRVKSYAYYSCNQSSCRDYRKSIPTALIHGEFESFLEGLAMPADLVETTIKNIVRFSVEQDALAKAAAQRARESIKLLENSLTELVTLRARALISDREFALTRDRLRKQVLGLQAGDESSLQRPLSQMEASGLMEVFQSLPALWKRLTPIQRSGFGRFLLPSGYDYQRIRTANLSLLFRAVAPARDHDTGMVDRAVSDTNTVIAEIRRFLAIIGIGAESEKKAA